ncbi:MAG: M14 family zinc carboxypeptidase, partial [Nocardioidaceae bacterium]
HSARDDAKLRRAGFEWTVEVRDLEAQARADQRANRQYAASVEQSGLPSGRTSYRHLDDYNAELEQLAAEYPDLTKPLTLQNRSVEGRQVHGIEITTDADRVDDGKPVFLMLGAHHAREWPSSEHSMEFAYDILQGYGENARATRIASGIRLIVVPIVNVDGFHISREATPLGDFSRFDNEMRRKNCGISEHTAPEYLGGTCEANPAGRQRGVDLNRNYPGFWGGPGASTNYLSDTYRGDDPGGEPEVDNIRQLISDRQVTNLITNHTYGNLTLRAPAIASTGYSPDEPTYRALGASMTDANNYANWASYQLYDTSGSTEDWSYWNTGGLGFTFEIGPEGFHPPFEEAVVAEYLGREPAAGAGRGGNREAYYRMAQATLDADLHSTITGTAPEGHTLKVSKQFSTATSSVIQPDGSTGPAQYVEDHLSSRLASDGGEFSWAVNPSTRPVVAGRYGREPQAPTEPDQDLANPAGTPAEMESETVQFRVQGMPTYDNGTAVVNIEWPDGAVDWDVYVYDDRGRLVAQAASLADPEKASLVDPLPGTYTVEVQNYSGGATSDWTGSVDFQPPTPPSYTGIKEAWMLTCVNRRGQVEASREVIVDRGESVDVGNACSQPATAEKGAASGR